MPYIRTLEWDREKSVANERKHGVPFALAGLVFKDRDRVEKPDPKHSLAETRFIVVGAVEGVILALICTRRGKAVRIISARKASRKERSEYRSRAN
jgi:uncharacterized protein